MFNESAALPPEALHHMREEFEGIKPIINEASLLELCDGDPNLEQLLNQFIEYSIRYAQDVWSMQIFVNKGGLETEEGAREFAEIDSARSRLHNTLTDSIAILLRALGKENREVEWARPLLNSDGKGLSRSACGALALLLVYERYIDTTR